MPRKLPGEKPPAPRPPKIRCVLVLRKHHAVALANLLADVRAEDPVHFCSTPLEEVFRQLNDER